MLLHKLPHRQATCLENTQYCCRAGLFELLAAASAGQAEQKADNSAPGAIQYLKTLDDNDLEARYVSASRDLNGDGIPEAIVYLISNTGGRSGGCSTFVLPHGGTSWRVVTNIKLTRPPIRVLLNSSNRWRNLGVRVRGGGIQQGYVAELRFEGKPIRKIRPWRPRSESTARRGGRGSTQDARLLSQ